MIFLFHVQKMIPSVTERGSPHVILRGIMQVMHTQAYNKTNHNNMTLCIHFKVKDVQNNHHYRFLFKWIASIRLLQMSVSCWHRCHGRRTEFRYTQESKYPTTKKSTCVKTDDCKGKSNLQPQLIIQSAMKLSNRNILTFTYKVGRGVLYVNKTGNAYLLCYTDSIWSCKSVIYHSAKYRYFKPDYDVAL